MGLQYACCDLVERVLGVRYLAPYFEHVPRVRRVTFPELKVTGRPDFQYRGIWVWHYGFVNGRNGNWNDLFGEVWKRRSTDLDMLKKVTDFSLFGFTTMNPARWSKPEFWG